MNPKQKWPYKVEQILTYQNILTFLNRYKRVFEIGLQFRQEVILNIFNDLVHSVSLNTINSNITQQDHNNYKILIDDFTINSLSILILGLLLSILTLFLELIYRNHQ